ncbi:Copper amine oxidase N-terminal domain-containing protein [Anaerovirgula multivorans]|uniref:Copper amine oxidase N-terminal domain-containing protein n=1 Tax=Anaerovirgula multivorans TaxID=312168 RepID=A0A239IIL8_9FIRM|nr:copper amine oxidase N-terminal domain-containing protein [Anaerovirgula multivorans]SNS93616.1 Copper amine oxidase N-terminal domain-containing protein [Anaerovirgula multivorans]
MFWKKFALICIICLLTLNGVAVTASAQDKINVKVDNSYIVFEDQDPMVVDGRTMVPMKKIFETLGADIDWDGSTNTVTALKEDTKIVLKIGADTARINGKEVMLDVPAQVINGRTMVPLKFVSEAMGAEVSWDDRTKTVVISTGEINNGNMFDVEPAKAQEQKNTSQDSGMMAVPSEGGSSRTPEQQREELKNKIQNLVENGTITQRQAEKIFDAFSGPAGIMMTPNALNGLVEQGVITKEQADAVMNAVRIGGQVTKLSV